MMKFLRSQSQLVLVVILIVIGFSFLFYGNVGNLLTTTSQTSNDFGSIEGTNLTPPEIFDAIHNTRNMFVLTGRGDALNQEGARAQLAEEAWRQLLLQHEAEKLHIVIGNDELVNAIRNNPLFQKDGAYSPDVYQSRMTQLEAALHLTPDGFQNMMRDNLRAEAVTKVLFSGIRTTSKNVGEAYEKFYAPTEISYVTIDPKTFASGVQVGQDEVEAAYKENPQNPAYRTQEKRRVEYVLFPFAPGQDKLTGTEKNAALQALGQKANDFAAACQPDPTATPAQAAAAPDFDSVAKTRGLSPIPTEFFTEDTAPKGVPPSPTFNRTAFELTKDNSIKIIQLGDAVAVVHLLEIQPSQLRPLDEVKAQIFQELQANKAEQSAEIGAQKAAQDLQAAMAKGSDFAAAAAALHLKVDRISAFIPTKAPESDQKLQTIGYVASTLPVGQVSQPVPVQSDGNTIIIHIDSRGQADPAGLADFEKRYRSTQDQQLRTLAYIDWANWMSKRPGTHRPPNLDQYGSIE